MEADRIYQITSNRDRRKVVTARLIGEYEKFYIFQTKYWKMCILKSSIKIGDYTVKEKTARAI